MIMIEGIHLRKTYRPSRKTTIEALRGVDVGIEAGEMVAIMGPSGSGKSTLMHLIGLLHRPDTDGGPTPELRIDGVDVTRLSDRDRTRIRARSMGFVFQSFNLVPTLTAEENVALAAEYAGVPGAAARERRRGRTGERRAGRPGPPSPDGAVRRRAAAGRDRSGHGQRAEDHPGRRTDRQSRLGARRRGARAPSAGQSGAWAHGASS